MARRGRFGRRPRTSPDLTATIVSMAREYQSTRDRNILNSWNEGGKFEGQQVTDQFLLKHLKSRRDGMSKDDPLWDELDQKLTEYTFAVDNSKMELKYAEGKVSDGGMAAFYAKAATKLPENSEAWRKMRTLAAQYKDRASSGGGGGGGGGGRGGGNGYNSKSNKIPLKKEVAYDLMMDGLTQIALREGILQTTEENLGDLRAFERDATRLVQLIEVFNSDPKYAADKVALTAQIRQYGNPNFSGIISWDTLAAEKVNKDSGLAHRITKAQKAGHSGDVKTLGKEMEEMQGIYNTAIAAGPLALYETARGQYDLETEAENVTPIEMWLSAQKFAAKLTGIHADVKAVAIATGDRRLSDMTGRLNNELISLSGGDADINAPTLWESSRGVVAGSLSSENGDTAKNVQGMRQLTEQMRLLTSGAGVIMRVDNTGQMTDNPEGSHYAVVPKAEVEEGAAWVPTAGSLPASVVFEGKTYPTGGIMTAVLPQRVFADATGPVDFTGRPTQSAAKPTGNQNIANIFVMPDGTRLAQYWDSAGTKRWTNNPDALFGNHKLEQGRDGYHIIKAVEDLVPATGTRAAKPAKEWDPYSVIDAAYTDPKSANTMVNTVGLSSFSMWLNSNRTSTSDPGVAYAMDPNVARAAITAEVGVAKPLELAAALREAETSRTDYLANTPDIQRRIRAVAAAGDPSTVADKLGVEGYADVGGLSRDVQGFYDRLRSKASGGAAAGPHGFARGDMVTAREVSERDELIRAALMEDPNQRRRIAAIEGGQSLLPPHIKSLMADQQTKALGPGFVTMGQWNKENMLVKGFKNLQQTQMAGWASALASPNISAAFATGPMAGPAAAKAPPPPKAPPKAAVPKDVTSGLTQAELERARNLKYKGIASRPGLSGTHPGGGGPQEY